MRNVDERIRFFLRIASRVEREGNERAARLFRRMAEEARPFDVGIPSVLEPATGACVE